MMTFQHKTLRWTEYSMASYFPVNTADMCFNDKDVHDDDVDGDDDDADIVVVDYEDDDDDDDDDVNKNHVAIIHNIKD